MRFGPLHAMLASYPGARIHRKVGRSLQTEKLNIPLVELHLPIPCSLDATKPTTEE